MSSRGRSKEPNRTRKRTMPTIKEEQVRVAVATSPSASDGAITKDVRLAKAALLYADEVEMVGLGVSMLEELRQRTSGPAGAWGLLRELDDDAMEYVLGQSGDRGMPDNWRTMLDLALNLDPSRVPPEQRQTITDLRQQMSEFSDGARPFVDGILNEAGAAELAVGVDARAIRVAQLDVKLSYLFRGKDRRSAESLEHIHHWVDALLERLQDRKLRILFDKESADLIQTMEREGKLPNNPQATRLAGQAALGAGLVAKLPAFDQARMDELLDLRKELSKPIKTYQGAVIRYSRNLPQTIGDDLAFDIDQMWQADVKPAVDELRDELAHHSLVREFGRNVDSKELGKFGWTSTVALGVGVIGNPSVIEAALLSGAAVGTPLVSAVIETMKSRGSALAEIKRRDFYMLYEARERLNR